MEVATIAGNDNQASIDGTGLNASFNLPRELVYKSGNLYVNDLYKNPKKIDLSNMEVVICRQNSGGSSDGNGQNTTFNSLEGITFIGDDLYISEYGNNKIRKLTIQTDVQPVTNNKITIDRTPPILIPDQLRFVSSNKPDNSSLFAKEGDNLTLTVKFSETVQQPSIKIANDSQGLQLSSNNDNSSWEAVYQVKQSDNSTGNFSISFLDQAGNVGSPVSGPQPPIIIDTVDPVLVKVQLYSDNQDNRTAKLHDNITLSLESSEPISAPVVNLAGIPGLVGVDVSNNGTIWNIITPVLDNTSEDNVSFSISIEDYAGNQVSGITQTTDNSSVDVDRTSPTLTLVEVESTNVKTLGQLVQYGKFGDNLTIRVESDEPLSRVQFQGSGSLQGNDIRR